MPSRTARSSAQPTPTPASRSSTPTSREGGRNLRNTPARAARASREASLPPVFTSYSTGYGARGPMLFASTSNRASPRSPIANVMQERRQEALAQAPVGSAPSLVECVVKTQRQPAKRGRPVKQAGDSTESREYQIGLLERQISMELQSSMEDNNESENAVYEYAHGHPKAEPAAANSRRRYQRDDQAPSAEATVHGGDDLNRLWKTFTAIMTFALLVLLIINVSPFKGMMNGIVDVFEELRPGHEVLPNLPGFTIPQADANRLHAQVLAEIKERLPQFLVIPIDQQGRPEIPENLWEALRDRVRLDADALIPTWEQFLRRNDVEIQQILEASKSERESLEKRKQIFDQAEVIHLIAQRSAGLEREVRQAAMDVRQRYNEFEEHSKKELIAFADKKIQEQLRTNIQIETLAGAMMLKNAEEAAKSFNFMAANIGARVHPQLTSPTHVLPKENWFQKTYRHYMPVRGPNPPVAALMRFDEAGDCWCASPPPPVGSTKITWSNFWTTDHTVLLRNRVFGEKYTRPGPKAQLAVRLPHAIYPKRIVIEHVRRQATLDITAAPRTLELWARIRDPIARVRVAEMSRRMLAEDGSAELYDSELTRAEDGDINLALDDEWVRLSRWQYDINAPNNVQSHELEVQMADFGVAVSQVVIRAASNWGQDYTCLYRIRLTGDVPPETDGMKAL